MPTETVKTYLESLNKSGLSTEAASYIASEILSDPDINNIDESDTDVKEVITIIKEKFPKALRHPEPRLKEAPPKPVTPAQVNKSKKKEYLEAIEAFKVMAEISKGKEKKEYREAIAAFKVMADLEAEQMKDGGHVRGVKEVNELLQQARTKVKNLTPAKIAEMWNKESGATEGGISKPLTVEEVEKSPSHYRMYLKDLLFEKQLTEPEYNKYFNEGGHVHGVDRVTVLQHEFADWCEKESLPLISADELLVDETVSLNDEQKKYLRDFIERWDKAQNKESVKIYIYDSQPYSEKGLIELADSSSEYDKRDVAEDSRDPEEMEGLEIDTIEKAIDFLGKDEVTIIDTYSESGIVISINGEFPTTYESFQKHNTTYGVESPSPKDFENIKNLKIGEKHHIGRSIIERVEKPSYAQSINEIANMLEKLPSEKEIMLFEVNTQEDRYIGHTPEQIWNALKPEQRLHFLEDHQSKWGGSEMELLKDIADKPFGEIPVVGQKSFTQHVSKGQYKEGGQVSKIPEKGTPEWHKLQIAKRTVRMHPAVADVMGGMTMEEANKMLEKYGIIYTGGGEKETPEGLDFSSLFNFRESLSKFKTETPIEYLQRKSKELDIKGIGEVTDEKIEELIYNKIKEAKFKIGTITTLGKIDDIRIGYSVKQSKKQVGFKPVKGYEYKIGNNWYNEHQVEQYTNEYKKGGKVEQSLEEGGVKIIGRYEIYKPEYYNPEGKYLVQTKKGISKHLASTPEEAIKWAEDNNPYRIELHNDYIYKGEVMTPIVLWQSWSPEQRNHFLKDHGINTIEHKSQFSDLSETIKKAIENHIQEGQYAKGGIVDELPSDTQEQVDIGKVTYRGTGKPMDEVNTKIRVHGKEYLVSREKFNELGGIDKIRFKAPHRRHYKEGGSVNNWVVDTDRYKDDKIYIKQERKKFVPISLETNERWANEFFKTEKELKDFAKQNKLIIVDVTDLSGLEKESKIKAIAKEFSKRLLEWGGEAKLRKAIAENELEKDGMVCHSHDFCDANQAMIDAFKAEGIDDDNMVPAFTQNDEAIAAWNKAWNLAKKNHFYIDKIKPKK